MRREEVFLGREKILPRRSSVNLRRTLANYNWFIISAFESSVSRSMTRKREGCHRRRWLWCIKKLKYIFRRPRPFCL
jgi:hypothetical protein